MEMKRLVLVGLASACAAVACRGTAPVGPFPRAPVILVSIDTLRADRLPLYGYRAGSAPAFDALGRDGVVFEEVYSHCPLTLPSHASLLTGLLPPDHGVRDNLGFSLADAHRTLAQRFKAAGLATGAAVSAYILRGSTGIGRGFDLYDDGIDPEAARSDPSLASLQRDGAVAVVALLRWIDERAEDERFFAFLHLFEPHSPYAPPERHRHHADPYDGELSYSDELLGRLVEGLRARGRLDGAVLAVTSDHGEGLGDHGEDEHGILLYREALHVPLVLRLPDRARAGLRLAGTVPLVDLPATLLDLAGLPTDGLDGASLRAAIDRGRVEPAAVYSETFYPRYHFAWSELFSATEGRYRFIRAPSPELYDLATDPAEKQNLAATRERLVARMGSWLDGRTAGPVAQPQTVSPETREALRALGYVGASAASARPSASLPDPKEKIGLVRRFREALGLKDAGRDGEAIAAFRALVAEEPGMADAWEMLGVTLARNGRTPEALDALGRVLETNPERASALLAMARLHALSGRTAMALELATRAVARDPGQAYEVLAQLEMDRGRPAEAEAFARKGLAAGGTRIMSEFILGVVAHQQGRCEEALEHFGRAEEAKRRRPHAVLRTLYAQMGECLLQLGRTAEAERAFRAELQVFPASREARQGLAKIEPRPRP
jgi:arylsulfatase A-like enzyme/tetratricopeptide (TPR) repeat protein